ncbi:hypothetical protein J2S89_000438 [Arthrobacter bambusae]|nr:hypothetical protein [Arthrobacter bambusae]MDQ0096576.1 hypothetical protein [Arthrobacter bambusae]
MVGALNGGLREGFGILYPRLGLTEASLATKNEQFQSRRTQSRRSRRRFRRCQVPSPSGGLRRRRTALPFSFGIVTRSLRSPAAPHTPRR